MVVNVVVFHVKHRCNKLIYKDIIYKAVDQMMPSFHVEP
jgi:hypothetical protein